VVYLSRQALDNFVALHTCAADSKFVLPSRYTAACRTARDLSCPLGHFGGFGGRAM
jgi:hypothetical protein